MSVFDVDDLRRALNGLLETFLPDPKVWSYPLTSVIDLGKASFVRLARIACLSYGVPSCSVLQVRFGLCFRYNDNEIPRT